MKYTSYTVYLDVKHSDLKSSSLSKVAFIIIQQTQVKWKRTRNKKEKYKNTTVLFT